MRVSHRWLLDYVDIPMAPSELASELERVGIETEEIECVGQGIDSVVVGQILSHTPHPHAPNLQIAKVSVGTEPLTIVCGAPNVKMKSKVAVALPGTVLPDGTRVAASEIRRIPSQGMLISERELGISDDHSGIIILPDSLTLGSKVAPYYELDDYVYEFEITPNRPDLLCIVGIAREISTITGAKLKLPRITIAESDEETRASVHLDVRDSEGCPRYMARVVRRVKVGKSPRWLAIRLGKCGLKEINNVVDATNYVLFELGHPLHSFDLKCVDNGNIVVRRAAKGERIITLDGDEKIFDDRVLLIADTKKPLAIAGIVGGTASGVTPSTNDVLLESAFFNPALIRTTSRLLGIETEASIRFEKKADISILPQALDRASQLIAQIAGGTISRGSLDFYPKPEPRPQITLNYERVNRLLGLNLSKREIHSSLRRLHIKADKNRTLHVPSFRRDLKEEVDLIEEVARIYGYERIPSTRQWQGSFVGARNARSERVNQLKQRLAGLGFTEVYALSFVDLQQTRTKGFANGVELLGLRNPLSERWDGLRSSLLPSLGRLAEANMKKGREWIKMFEIGKVFEGTAEDFKEEEHLALLSSGERFSWVEKEEKADFYSLKGDVESFLDSTDVEDVAFASTAYPFLHPGRAAEILLGDERLGIMGELILAQRTVRRVYVAEFNLEILLNRMMRRKFHESVRRFPVVDRDIALLAADQLPFRDIFTVIRREGGKYLESVELFDLYVGDGIPKGSKSLTYRLRFRAKDRTLRDEEVDGVIDRILSSLREELNVNLRGG